MNLALLMDNKPIHILREQLNLPFDIVIHAGKTEDDILEELKSLGLITENTQIKK